MLFFADSILAQKSVVQTIVLGAGHGGKDPGAPGTGRYTKTEKHIALDVTLKLGKYLKEAFPEMKIVYTRTKIYLFLFIVILLQNHLLKEVLRT